MGFATNGRAFLTRRSSDIRSHFPSAKWSEQCVMARAPDALHSMPKANTLETSRASFDFCFLKTAGDYGARVNLQQTCLHLVRTRGASNPFRVLLQGDFGILYRDVVEVWMKEDKKRVRRKSKGATKVTLDRPVADVGVRI